MLVMLLSVKMLILVPVLLPVIMMEERKNKTEISDGAFIGSNTALVAPIKIGKRAIVGAGSALTKNVKNKSLALTRANQIEIKNYKRK